MTSKDSKEAVDTSANAILEESENVFLGLFPAEGCDSALSEGGRRSKRVIGRTRRQSRTESPELKAKERNDEVMKRLNKLEQELNNSFIFSSHVLSCLHSLHNHSSAAISSMSRRISWLWLQQLSSTLNAAINIGLPVSVADVSRSNSCEESRSLQSRTKRSRTKKDPGKGSARSSQSKMSEPKTEKENSSPKRERGCSQTDCCSMRRTEAQELSITSDETMNRSRKRMRLLKSKLEVDVKTKDHQSISTTSSSSEATIIPNVTSTTFTSPSVGNLKAVVLSTTSRLDSLFCPTSTSRHSIMCRLSPKQNGTALDETDRSRPTLSSLRLPPPQMIENSPTLAHCNVDEKIIFPFDAGIESSYSSARKTSMVVTTDETSAVNEINVIKAHEEKKSSTILEAAEERSETISLQSANVNLKSDEMSTNLNNNSSEESNGMVRITSSPLSEGINANSLLSQSQTVQCDVVKKVDVRINNSCRPSSSTSTNGTVRQRFPAEQRSDLIPCKYYSSARKPFSSNPLLPPPNSVSLSTSEAEVVTHSTESNSPTTNPASSIRHRSPPVSSDTYLSSIGSTSYLPSLKSCPSAASAESVNPPYRCKVFSSCPLKNAVNKEVLSNKRVVEPFVQAFQNISDETIAEASIVSIQNVASNNSTAEAVESYELANSKKPSFRPRLNSKFELSDSKPVSSMSSSEASTPTNVNTTAKESCSIQTLDEVFRQVGVLNEDSAHLQVDPTTVAGLRLPGQLHSVLALSESGVLESVPIAEYFTSSNGSDYCTIIRETNNRKESTSDVLPLSEHPLVDQSDLLREFLASNSFQPSSGLMQLGSKISPLPISRHSTSVSDCNRSNMKRTDYFLPQINIGARSLPTDHLLSRKRRANSMGTTVVNSCTEEKRRRYSDGDWFPDRRNNSFDLDESSPEDTENSSLQEGKQTFGSCGKKKYQAHCCNENHTDERRITFTCGKDSPSTPDIVIDIEQDTPPRSLSVQETQLHLDSISSEPEALPLQSRNINLEAQRRQNRWSITQRDHAVTKPVNYRPRRKFENLNSDFELNGDCRVGNGIPTNRNSICSNKHNRNIRSKCKKKEAIRRGSPFLLPRSGNLEHHKKRRRWPLPSPTYTEEDLERIQERMESVVNPLLISEEEEIKNSQGNTAKKATIKLKRTGVEKRNSVERIKEKKSEQNNLSPYPVSHEAEKKIRAGKCGLTKKVIENSMSNEVSPPTSDVEFLGSCLHRTAAGLVEPHFPSESKSSECDVTMGCLSRANFRLLNRENSFSSTIQPKPVFKPAAPFSKIVVPKLLMKCSVHGITKRCGIRPQRWPKALYQPKILTQAECTDCRSLIQRFVNAAPSRSCVIEGIEVASSTTNNIGSASSSSSSSSSSSLSSSSSSSATGYSRASALDIRVRLLCGRGHKFFASSATVNTPVWCPVCLHQNELKSSQRNLSYQQKVMLETEAQEKQKQLFEEAKRRYNAMSHECSTTHLPPCMKKKTKIPLGSPFIPVFPPFVSPPFIGVKRSSLRARMQENITDKGEDIITLARRDAELWEGVTTDHALPVRQVLRGGKNPWRTLQVEEPPYWSGSAAQMKVFTIQSEAYQAAKSSYKNLARKVHPDKNPHPKANEAFLLVDEAWRNITSRVLNNSNNTLT